MEDSDLSLSKRIHYMVSHPRGLFENNQFARFFPLKSGSTSLAQSKPWERERLLAATISVPVQGGCCGEGFSVRTTRPSVCMSLLKRNS